MTAVFVKETQDVERLDAQGNAKFNENDRNGVAANISYVAADDMVRLSGGEPTVWDSRARTKAIERSKPLDDVSYSRAGKLTTFYARSNQRAYSVF